MNEIDSKYQEILRIKAYGKDALTSIGNYIDLAAKENSAIHTEQAINYLTACIENFKDNDDKCLAHYFLSIAWSDIRRLKRHHNQNSWDWEQEEIEQEIINLRKAERLFKNAMLEPERYCQILTNLGNLFDYTGRYIEALRYWNKAISIEEHFGMAIINKGNSLIYHGLNSMHAREYQLFFIQAGYRELKFGRHFDIEIQAREECNERIDYLEKNHGDVLKKRITLNKPPHADAEADKNFCKWALDKNLLLNPLIDIEHYEFALEDEIKIPTDSENGLKLYEQIKAEYRLARRFLYDSLEPESANQESAEKQKLSFRIAYSLFDKVAYLINEIFGLSVPLHKVDFHKLWFVGVDKKKGLRDDLAKNNNFILRGLYWVSKELYYNDPQYRSSIEPDAQEIAKIRNYLEHKSFEISDVKSQNEFSYITTKGDFESKTVRLLLLIRECIMYIPFAIYRDATLKTNTP